MDDRGYDDEKIDKQWASNYILGPLYDLEPSQESATRVAKALPPTPPSSASPTRPHFPRRLSLRKSQVDEDPEDQPFLRRLLSRSSSVNSRPPAVSPPRPSQRLTQLERQRSLHTSRPPATHWNQGTILARANSVSSSRPSQDVRLSQDARPKQDVIDVKRPVRAMGEMDAVPRRGGSLSERHPGDKTHRPLERNTQEHRAEEGSNALPRRGGSLRERYPGDLSHRPLAMIQRDFRAADRAPYLHNRRRRQPSDTIDSLDHTGPNPTVYHHSGPFDPATKARNSNKMYSPVEAVKDTNNEALKATPAEFIRDAFDKHVPLQGIAIIPPGMKDMSGRTMDYSEGADLMRDRDAPGGAYKRWDHVPYKDEDLKGKGEPAFTIEREIKRNEMSRKPVASSSAGGTAYEMQPSTATSNRKNEETQVRQRSVSNTGVDHRSPPRVITNPYLNGDLQRRNTTGRSLAQSLMRRFGSLRRKKSPEDGVYTAIPEQRVGGGYC